MREGEGRKGQVREWTYDKTSQNGLRLIKSGNNFFGSKTYQNGMITCIAHCRPNKKIHREREYKYKKVWKRKGVEVTQSTVKKMSFCLI